MPAADRAGEQTTMALNNGILNSTLLTNDSADVTYDSMDVIIQRKQ
jgi:hypothetical protein